jgi:hypothetical protein
MILDDDGDDGNKDADIDGDDDDIIPASLS